MQSAEGLLTLQPGQQRAHPLLVGAVRAAEVLAPLGAAACLYVVMGLPVTAWYRFVV